VVLAASVARVVAGGVRVVRVVRVVVRVVVRGLISSDESEI
jgi:hypothetical protein